MREGSDLFTVHAYLPAEASFGFADELRRRSSGAATASLMLSHWERLQVRAGGLWEVRWLARLPNLAAAPAVIAGMVRGGPSGPLRDAIAAPLPLRRVCCRVQQWAH